jgi:sulfur carrier protein
MNVYVNNKEQEVGSAAKIDELLSVLNINAQKGIAIAVNNNVVPRAEWEKHELQPEDKVMLIRATQGG